MLQGSDQELFSVYPTKLRTERALVGSLNILDALGRLNEASQRIRSICDWVQRNKGTYSSESDLESWSPMNLAASVPYRVRVRTRLDQRGRMCWHGRGLYAFAMRFKEMISQPPVDTYVLPVAQLLFTLVIGIPVIPRAGICV